jgi:hypothetical protein
MTTTSWATDYVENDPRADFTATFANLQGDGHWAFYLSTDKREYLIKPWVRNTCTDNPLHCFYLVAKIGGRYSDLHAYATSARELMQKAESWDAMSDDDIRLKITAPGWLPTTP